MTALIRNLFLAFLLFSFSNSHAPAQFSGGSGTEGPPYQIETLEQLQAIENEVNLDLHFMQTADIDAGETVNWNVGDGFKPIGSNRIRGLVVAATFPKFAEAEGGSRVAPSDIDSADRIVMPERGISSHRGENYIHPENTLTAFSEAIRAGAHQIELDIYLTDHGDLVVIHDNTVDRTTDGSGDVRHMTLDEIKKLDAGSWKDPRFAGERIPTLDEALEIMPRNVWLNLHVKGGYETAAAVAKKVLDHGRQHQAFLATGHAGAEGARSVYPDILICNMSRRPNNVAQYIEETIEHGYAFIQLHHRHEQANADQISQLKDAGVRVNYFGTNNALELRELFERGIEFPLVDNLLPMMEEAKRLGIEPLVPVY